MRGETELDPTAGLSTGVEIRQLRIDVVEGPDAGLNHVTSGDACSIGSHPSNDLVLTDTRVSRFHCEARIDEGSARLVDQGSRNGTIVDGVRVQDGWLRDGSLVRLGRDVLSVQLLASTNRIRLSPATRFGTLVGSSVAMRGAFAALERAASTDSTVLILGETGTGKEEAARSVHLASSRAEGPFVVVDCGAIAGSLIESQLFGHVKGAFTGATDTHVGAFEAAHGGTVFLDEIGELPIDLQPRLLRVLEERTVLPVGGSARKPIDVRLVAATHRDLRAEVNAGRFRSDLYYRLAVVKVVLPALRERPEDIPLLVSRLLDGLDADGDTIAKLTAPDALLELQRGAWPGNVRQLRNHLERAVLLGFGLEVGEMVDASVIDPRLSYNEARKVAISDFERRYVAVLLDHHSGNVSAAARAAGMNRVYIHELLRRHGLR